MKEPETPVQRAAHNAVLLLTARIATVVIPPLVLAAAIWVVSSVQQLRVDVAALTGTATGQIQALTLINNQQDARIVNLEGRLDGLMKGGSPK